MAELPCAGKWQETVVHAFHGAIAFACGLEVKTVSSGFRQSLEDLMQTARPSTTSWPKPLAVLMLTFPCPGSFSSFFFIS